MEELRISSNDPNNSPIDANLFNISDNGKLLVVIGGSGDDKDKFMNLAKLLDDKEIDRDIVTFSFRGLKDEALYSLNQQSQDLEDVLVNFINKRGYDDVALVCTSMGAYSATALLIDKKLKDRISNAIFIDPADYYLKDGDKPEGSYAWTGYAEYDPDSKTANDRLKEIDSDVKVHVINFTIRNRGPEGYAPLEKRGVDNPKLFTRLNNDMVKAFYTNTPEKNRGEYFEDNTIPHAFLRDGNVKQNQYRVADLIIRCLGQQERGVNCK